MKKKEKKSSLESALEGVEGMGESKRREKKVPLRARWKGWKACVNRNPEAKKKGEKSSLESVVGGVEGVGERKSRGEMKGEKEAKEVQENEKF